MKILIDTEDIINMRQQMSIILENIAFIILTLLISFLATERRVKEALKLAVIILACYYVTLSIVYVIVLNGGHLTI